MGAGTFAVSSAQTGKETKEEHYLGRPTPQQPAQLSSERALSSYKKKRKKNATPNGQLHIHSNQPSEFKITSLQFFHIIVEPSMNKRQVIVPMCHSTNSDECLSLRFIFVGECNSNCPRAATHTPIADDKNRMEILRKFLQDCHNAYKSNKSTTDPDILRLRGDMKP